MLDSTWAMSPECSSAHSCRQLTLVPAVHGIILHTELSCVLHKQSYIDGGTIMQTMQDLWNGRTPVSVLSLPYAFALMT